MSARKKIKALTEHRDALKAELQRQRVANAQTINIPPPDFEGLFQRAHGHALGESASAEKEFFDHIEKALHIAATSMCPLGSRLASISFGDGTPDQPAMTITYSGPRMPAPVEETWSLNNETYGFDSLAELLDNCPTVEPGHVVYRGTKHYEDPANFVSADMLIDDLREQMQDNASANGNSEWCSGYPEVPDEAGQEFETLLEAWVREHCQPTFFMVKDSTPYTVTAEDLA
jgi:hypothetical protein